MTRVAYKGIADAKPPQAVPAGKYQLRIMHAEGSVPSKTSNAKMTQTRCEIMGQPQAAQVFTNLVEPTVEDEYLSDNSGKTHEDWLKAEEFKALQAKTFCDKFSIEYDTDGYETEDFLGSVGDVWLDVEPHYQTGLPQNVMNLFK